MIGPGAGAKVMVATRPVDFRKGPCQANRGFDPVGELKN